MAYDPWQPAPYSSQPKKTRTWIVALITTMVIVTIGVATYALLRNPGEKRQPTGTSAKTFDQEIEALKKFVEKERGLKFKAPVAVVLLDDDAFEKRILDEAEQEQDAEDLADSESILKALELIPADAELKEELDSLLGGSVVGLYDPEKKELVVRGADLTPYTRSTLVHELTHALQDQHFNIHRPEYDDRDDEIALGFSAIVEGDATRIASLYEETLSSSEQRFISRAERALQEDFDPSIPQPLQVILGFPYLVGPFVVEALLDDGGQPRLDQAFVDPPTTTEQLIDPGRYLAREAAISVPLPPVDGEAFDQGIFGQLALVLILGPGGGAGWGGDSYVAYKKGGSACVRADFKMDNSTAQRTLNEGLIEWSRTHSNATVKTGSTTRLTACT